MPKGSIATGLLVAFLINAPGAQGQKATEQFIPIGQSPGLSPVLTDLAAIAEVDAGAQTITLPMGAGSRSPREPRSGLTARRAGNPT